MDSDNLTSKESGVSVKIDDVPWDDQTEDALSRIHDGSEKSDYIEDLLADDGDSIRDKPLGLLLDQNKDGHIPGSKIHPASHTSTVSLKSFDVHSDVHCQDQRLATPESHPRRAKDMECCIIQ